MTLLYDRCANNLLLELKGNYPAREHSNTQCDFFSFSITAPRSGTKTILPTDPSLPLSFSHPFCLRLYSYYSFQSTSSPLSFRISWHTTKPPDLENYSRVHCNQYSCCFDIKKDWRYKEIAVCNNRSKNNYHKVYMNFTQDSSSKGCSRYVNI